MEKKQDFKSLRALRAVFMLMIVFFHIGDTFAYYGSETFKLKYIYEYGGDLGNIFFFMSSGFLIDMVYKKRIVSGEYTFPKFFFGRLKKILPIYWFTNFLLIIYTYYVNGPTATSVDRIFRTMLCIQSGWKAPEFPYNLVGWFVNVLILCYIIYFVICHVSKLIKNENAFVYLTILWCIIGYSVHSTGCTLPFLSWQNSIAYISFSLGILLYELYNYIPERRMKSVSCKVTLFFISFSIISVVMNHYIGLEKFYGDYKIVLMFIVMPSIIFISVTIPFIERVSRVLLPIGNISTQLCFYHLPVLYYFKSYILYDLKLSDSMKLLLYLIILFTLSIIDERVNYYVSKRRKPEKS